MSDLVVTVPRKMWPDWIEEGDAVGEPETGEEWGFYLGWNRPPVEVGERLYIVAHDRLRGYAPVTRVAFFVSWCERPACMLRPCDQCKLSEADNGHVERPRCGIGTGSPAPGRWAIGRKGSAVAVTLPEQIKGFRGWRERWWNRGDEQPFPDWIETDLWLNRRKRAAKRKLEAGDETVVAVPPDPQRSLFE